jgi:hypothetical protein
MHNLNVNGVRRNVREGTPRARLTIIGHPR